MDDLKAADPRGLIGQAYEIEGIGAGECRSVFLDWALGMPSGADQTAAMRVLLGGYGNANPDHPMSQLLRDGLAQAAEAGPAQRRGGRDRHRG